MKKIVGLRELRKEQKRFANKKTVLVGGCFDLFHFGHLDFLKKAKTRGNFLIVALESDQFVRETKKRTPVHNQIQRAEILQALEIVDLVVLLPLMRNYEEYLDLVKLVKPTVIAVTAGDPQLENKKKQAAAVGAKVEIVSEKIPGFSGKRIISSLGF